MTLGTVIFVYSSDLIEIIPRSKIAGSTDRNIFKAFDTLPSCLPERLCHFTPAVHSSQRGAICTSKLSLQAKASAEAEQSPCYLSHCTRALTKPGGPLSQYRWVCCVLTGRHGESACFGIILLSTDNWSVMGWNPVPPMAGWCSAADPYS